MATTFASRYDNAPFSSLGFCAVPTALLHYAATLAIEPDECWLLTHLISLRYDDRPLTPTVPRLAQRMGKSEATVKRMVAALVARKIISTRQPQREEGRWAKSVYDLSPLFALLDCCVQQADTAEPTVAHSCATVEMIPGDQTDRSAKVSYGPERKGEPRSHRQPERISEPRTVAHPCATILESSNTLQDSSNTYKNTTTIQDAPAAVVDRYMFENAKCKEEKEQQHTPENNIGRSPVPLPAPVPAKVLPEKTLEERRSLLRLLRDKGIGQPGADSVLMRYTAQHLQAALACAPVLPSSYTNPGGVIVKHINTFDFGAWEIAQSKKATTNAVAQTRLTVADAVQEAVREATRQRLDALTAEQRDATLAAAWRMGVSAAEPWPGEAAARLRVIKWPTVMATLPKVFAAQFPLVPQAAAPQSPAPVQAGKPAADFAVRARREKMAADLAETQERLAAQQRRKIEKQEVRKVAETAEYERVRGEAQKEREAEAERQQRRQGLRGGGMSALDMAHIIGLPDADTSVIEAAQTTPALAPAPPAADALNHIPTPATPPTAALGEAANIDGVGLIEQALLLFGGKVIGDQPGGWA